MEKHLAGGGMIICATHDNLRIKDEMVKNFDVTKFSVSLSSSGDDWS
jgi:ABC-type transport system involved in cytochrome c biogenesis ATPase subunit